MLVVMVTCPECETEFDESGLFCPNCGLARTMTKQAMQRIARLTGEDYVLVEAYTKAHGLRRLTVEQRQSQLEDVIQLFTFHHFTLMYKDDHSASMTAPKKSVGCGILVLGVLTFGLLLIAWLIANSGKSAEPVLIEVDPWGEIVVTGYVGSTIRRQIAALNDG